MEKQRADITVEDHGTIAVFELNTDAARDWVAEHVIVEGWQGIGKHRFGVEPRFGIEIMFEALNAGLTVET